MRHLRHLSGLLICLTFLLRHDPAAADPQPVTLRVLTFNVNDLPRLWGASDAPRLDYIGEDLARRRAAGTAPDVVLLQEAFTERARRLVTLAGYPYVTRGPARKQAAPANRTTFSLSMTHAKSQPFYPTGVVINSGLYVLSRYPIVAHDLRMYGGQTCTGYDCLANKSVLHVKIAVPGLPDPVDIFTTHMQANIEREASARKRLNTHLQQTEIVRAFLREKLGPQGSAIFAGDFNIRSPIERYDLFVQETGVTNAGLVCVQNPTDCEIGPRTQLEMLWRYTNDYQFLLNGGRYRFTPIYMARNYGDLVNGKPLSDHLGFEAVYRIDQSL